MCDYMELARQSDATRKMTAQLADKTTGTPPSQSVPGNRLYGGAVVESAFQTVSPADLSVARSATEGPYQHYAPDICPKCGPEGQRMQRAALSQFSNNEVVFYCPKHNLTQLQPSS
jgi:hypothetical protein